MSSNVLVLTNMKNSVVNSWNMLPPDVVDTASIQAFKNRLVFTWSEKKSFFNYFFPHPQLSDLRVQMGS